MENGLNLAVYIVLRIITQQMLKINKNKSKYSWFKLHLIYSVVFWLSLLFQKSCIPMSYHNINHGNWKKNNFLRFSFKHYQWTDVHKHYRSYIEEQEEH